MRLPAGVRMILRSNAVWRVSGIVYPTAVYATKGKFMPVESYLNLCGKELSETVPVDLLADRPCTLEFGCGLGGHLISAGRSLSRGVGIDVNRGYIRIARRLTRRAGLLNLKFLSYDGENLPDIDRFGLVVCLNVLERIPKTIVARYLNWISSQMNTGAWLVASFLHEGATMTRFVDKLGPEAYVYWNRDEVRDTLKSANLAIVGSSDWNAIAHVVVARKAHASERQI